MILRRIETKEQTEFRRGCAGFARISLFTRTVNTAGLSQVEEICTHPVWEELMEGKKKETETEIEGERAQHTAISSAFT